MSKKEHWSKGNDKISYLKKDAFIEVAKKYDCNVKKMLEHFDSVGTPLKQSGLTSRLARYRKNGLLPLDSGNTIGLGEQLKGTSTLYDQDGNVKIQWVKTDVAVEAKVSAIEKAVKAIAKKLRNKHTPVPFVNPNTLEDLATVYISNDIHFGALMWEPESGTDWDLDIASSTVNSAYDYLFNTSPDSAVGIVVDLGDLTEVDNYKNMTPHSGNILSVDSRFPKILKAAYTSLIYAVDQALLKHELVYFVNIAGNHDIVTGLAIREIIAAWFRNEPRVIVDISPTAIKYHQHGQTLLQFAHGDGMKMSHAGEVMAVDCQDIFSDTTARYSHFGHTHKDAVYDGRICKAESHRNLAPLNDWAAHKGFRRQLGTMKSITYSDKYGEISRNLYNITLSE